MAVVRYIVEVHMDWEGDPDYTFELQFESPDAAIVEDDVLDLKDAAKEGYTNARLTVYQWPADPRVAYFKRGDEVDMWRCPTHYADGGPVEKEYRDAIARALHVAQR